MVGGVEAELRVRDRRARAWSLFAVVVAGVLLVFVSALVLWAVSGIWVLDNISFDELATATERTFDREVNPLR